MRVRWWKVPGIANIATIGTPFRPTEKISLVIPHSDVFPISIALIYVGSPNPKGPIRKYEFTNG